MHKLKVLISGGGPAGLSAAISLDKTKYDVTVVERGPTFMNMGFSIILWHAGLDVLQKILGTTHIQGLWPLNTFSIYGGENIELLQSANTSGIGYSIERKVLIDHLSKKFIDTCGKNAIHFNTFIKDMSFEGEQLNVRFNDASTENYDILIAADGMHSFARMGYFDAKLETKPYKITYSWIKPGSNLKDEALVGFMKDYTYLIQTVNNKALLAYYNHADQQDNQIFLQNIKHYMESARGGTFELETDTAHNFMSEVLHVQQPYNRNIVLVGDAYHGHPPTLGMGTSMAIEDSYELAHQLNTIDTSDFSMPQLEQAFADYAKIRHEDIRKTYDTQDRIEALIVSGNSEKIALAEMMLKYGGWTYIKPLLLSVFAGPTRAE